jgi:hypothetical protein
MATMRAKSVRVRLLIGRFDRCQSASAHAAIAATGASRELAELGYLVEGGD